MNEILKKQIWRKLEAMPEEKVYQVLDYIQYLESEYGSRDPGPRGVQRLGELVQDQMRKHRVSAKTLKEAMRVLGSADRVLDAFRDAGREFLAELEAGRPEPPPKSKEDPPRSREIVIE